MKKESNLLVYCDGGARGNPGPGACAFIVSSGGKIIHTDSKYLGVTTNNKAEYQAVVLALNWLLKNPLSLYKKIDFFLDSELVVRQLTALYKIKNRDLESLFFEIKKLQSEIKKPVSFNNIPRTKNRLADYLVNKILDEKF